MGSLGEAYLLKEYIVDQNVSAVRRCERMRLAICFGTRLMAVHRANPRTKVMIGWQHGYALEDLCSVHPGQTQTKNQRE